MTEAEESEKREEIKSGVFVIPGEFLGVTEEYLAGPGTYVEDGRIYSSITGYVMIDHREKRISVFPAVREPVVLREGDVVIGRVTDVKDQVVLVRIAANRRSHAEDKSLASPATGAIHISQIKDAFVKDISAEFRIGDIVKAKVINARKTPIQLSTIGRFFGVIKAWCSNCRSVLRRRGSRLVCPNCGRVETRKLAMDYGKGTV